MEHRSSKIFLTLLLLCSSVWIYAMSMKNYRTSELLTFGTIEFESALDPVKERAAYHSIAELTLTVYASYPFVLFFAFGYLRTTRRTLKTDGWLMMSAIMLFLFIPVEIYCFWLDWKIVGLNYWGEWPLEEFRKAVLARITALGGLPFVAQLCYFTIPVLAVWQPLKSVKRKEL